MDCPRCDAVVPPRAEFCPHCSMAMHPPLRERVARARGDVDLKRHRRTIFIAGAVFLFGLVIGGHSGIGHGFDFDDHHPRRPAVIGAQPLDQAYRDDADAADERFDDRFMVVTGEFVGIVPDGHGHPDLRFRTSDPATPLGADLIESAHAESARLLPGQTVTVGCDGIVSDGEERWLRDCAIETVAPGRAAPLPGVPADPSRPPSEPAPR